MSLRTRDAIDELLFALLLRPGRRRRRGNPAPGPVHDVRVTFAGDTRITFAGDTRMLPF